MSITLPDPVERSRPDALLRVRRWRDMAATAAIEFLAAVPYVAAVLGGGAVGATVVSVADSLAVPLWLGVLFAVAPAVSAGFVVRTACSVVRPTGGRTVDETLYAGGDRAATWAGWPPLAEVPAVLDSPLARIRVCVGNEVAKVRWLWSRRPASCLAYCLLRTVPAAHARRRVFERALHGQDLRTPAVKQLAARAALMTDFVERHGPATTWSAGTYDEYEHRLAHLDAMVRRVRPAWMADYTGETVARLGDRPGSAA